MKGVVFTELLEMLEDAHGLSFVEALVADCELPSGGAYTAIGTYPAEEMRTLLTALSARTGAPKGALLETFGRHLLGHFATGYPHFFAAQIDVFEFLERVEDHIHVEVRKLYPDAELPRFETERAGDNTLHMRYRSERGLAALAFGLIAGCCEHYGVTVQIIREDLSGGAGTDVRFTLVRQPG